jgi:hypothetical protein
LFKGFFFLFVYKDFVLREIIQKVLEQLPQTKEKGILAPLEKDYALFVERDLSTWCNVMM